MKKSLFILFFSLVFCQNLFSQTYHPFPDKEGIWKYSTYNYEYGQHFYGTATQHYKLDTSTGYMAYVSGNITRMQYISNKSYYEKNKRIYFNTGSKFELVFDFNLTVGDSFIIPQYYRIYADSIGVVIQDFAAMDPANPYPNRRVLGIIALNSSSPYVTSTNYWVEGIGNVSSQVGIDHPTWNWTVSGTIDFKCLHSNNTSYPCQNAITLPGQKTNLMELSVYPNPSSKLLNLEGINFPFESIQIINKRGQEVNMNFKFNEITNQIDISELPIGLYFLIIKTQDGQYFSERVVKN